MFTYADWAEALARDLLASNRRPAAGRTSQGVAATARTLTPVLRDDEDLVTAAAWLHDIGYAPDLARHRVPPPRRRPLPPRHPPC